MSLRETYKKPTESTGTTFKKPFPLAQGKNLFRLIPPSLFNLQGWYVWGATHFGYTIVDANGKTQYRPFECPRDYNRKTKVEKVPCAECNKIEKLTNELEDLTHDWTKKVEAGVASNIDMEEALLEHVEFLDKHNRDSKYFIPVMNAQGEFGYIKVGSSIVNALRERIAELDAEGIDPWNPDQGAIFNIARKGDKKTNTEYSVAVEQELVEQNGKTYKTTKLAPLSDAQLEQAVRDVPDLHNLSTKISQRQIEMLAASNGSSEVVAAILGLEVNGPKARQESVPHVNHKPVAEPPQTLAPAHAEVEAELDEEAALQAQLAAIQARKAAKFNSMVQGPAPVTPVVPHPASADPKLAAQEFMKKFSNK